MIRIQDVRVTPAGADDRATGLMAYVALTLPGDIRLDGITLRRTTRNTLSVSYPERRSASGDAHPLIWPLTPEARAEFEALVIAEARRQRLGK